MTPQEKTRSHCPICNGKTGTVWKEQMAFCEKCGNSSKEMASKGLNASGPWHHCENCQANEYYELQDGGLCCDKCGMTQEQGEAVEAARPQLISYRPRDVTAGALMEIRYLSDRSHLPNVLAVAWSPNRGQTIIRLREEELKKAQSTFTFVIEVPFGARSAVIRDSSLRSKECRIDIDYEARKVSKPNAFLRLLGFK